MWSPPLGNPGGTGCSGASGPTGSNVTAAFSLGAGMGQPWQAATAVAVAPYGQIVFYTGSPTDTLNSLSAAGGTTNFRTLLSNYFPTCQSGAILATAPATDALRVYTSVSCIITPGSVSVFAAAADMSSGSAVWSPTTPVLVATIPSYYPPTLLVSGSRLWVGYDSPLSPSILDTASGTVLASNFTPTAPYCNLLSATYAVCNQNVSGNSLSQTVVFSTAALPPTPAWSNYMSAEFIAADASQLIATTGYPNSPILSGFDLATGALAWSLACPWQGYDGAIFAYDDAGTVFAAWLGFDETQHFSAIVASYSIAGAGSPTQIANVSITVPFSTNAIQSLTLSNNGKYAYMTLAGNAGTSIVSLAASAGTLTVAATAITVPAGTQMQGVPGPQDGQMIIGQLAASGQPSLAVYA